MGRKSLAVAADVYNHVLYFCIASLELTADLLGLLFTIYLHVEPRPPLTLPPRR